MNPTFVSYNEKVQVSRENYSLQEFQKAQHFWQSPEKYSGKGTTIWVDMSATAGVSEEDDTPVKPK